MLTLFLRFMSGVFQYTLRTFSIVQLFGDKHRSNESSIFSEFNDILKLKFELIVSFYLYIKMPIIF